jgi:hypothetical protein
MKYFDLKLLKNPNCSAELDKHFRELCHTEHPDKGGSNDKFVAIKDEYEEYKVLIKYYPELNTLFAPKKTIVVEKIIEKFIPVIQEVQKQPQILERGLDIAKAIGNALKTANTMQKDHNKKLRLLEKLQRSKDL